MGVDGEALPFPAPTRTLNDKYASLANLRKGVTWEDPFFDDEDFENDIIAVFDFDYVKMESFNTSMGFATLFSTLIYAPIFVLAHTVLYPQKRRMVVAYATRCDYSR